VCAASSAGDELELRCPGRQHGLVVLQRAVADQQPDEVTLGLGVRAVPSEQRAVVVQQHLIARAQRAGCRPFRLDGVAGLAVHAAHGVVGGQAQRVALGGAQREHRLAAGFEEACRFGRVGTAVDHRVEGRADEFVDLACAVRRHHPGVGRDAGIRARDRLAIRQVVVAVDAVEEQHARLGMVVGRAHHLVPQVAGAQLAIDPQPAVLVRAGGLLRGAGLGAVHQRELGVGGHRLHERIGHADREVEVLQVAFVLGVDELLDVRVVAAQHAHLRAAARAGAFDRLARAVEHAHVADRARRVAARAAHPRAARADAREVVAHAAAAAHGLGGLGQRGVDAGVAVVDLRDRVAHRLHEAVDQRGRQVGARRRRDAPGRHEAGGQRGGEALLPVAALFGRLGLRERAGDAGVHVGGAAFAVLGVFLEQHLGADRLGGERGGGRRARGGVVGAGGGHAGGGGRGWMEPQGASSSHRRAMTSVKTLTTSRRPLAGVAPHRLVSRCTPSTAAARARSPAPA
jgi:hypothetical protein